ncbi:MAG: response regulator [Leptospiraceae bacterium]|nr:response regulator [Leptospiraceae bacterium]MCB1199061.1 response regulator [Leptospiraceae bacterium]
MKTILIIDDSISIRQVVSLTLRTSGYNVVEAVDGHDALSKLASVKPNMIICDINMPNMDGLTFLKTIKNESQYAEFKFLPIVMLTTVAEEDKKQEGQEAGAKAWIVKPFQPDKLLSAVQKLIL